MLEASASMCFPIGLMKTWDFSMSGAGNGFL